MIGEESGPYAGVAAGAAATPFASIAYVAETGSTNVDAAALLGDERFAGRTLVAEYQSRGAGRKGRTWHAAPGTSLLFTTILPRAVATESLWLVPFWVALAVRAALRECGVSTTLQWPNDLLLDERKIAGVLCQSRVTGTTARVACGVGINVHRTSAAAGIEPPPAFCDDVVRFERALLLRAALMQYHRTLFMLDEPYAVIDRWNVAARLPGRRYRLRLDNTSDVFEATARGLAEGGGLRIVRDDGGRATVSLADARALR
ncbi:MAG TPA: biotin--[acetyl-CoA-carboxylase] ligase [Candidatus Baltobacteraceae bacterium]|jgi:BirA family biotin operon repressor/biotin-[acetyl-CoA-carboxylase] ligase|nr:biotin--[acetyl-CoA-carboxylase] ligase [Candidatus Baltobacteraceae bacterium]